MAGHPQVHGADNALAHWADARSVAGLRAVNRTEVKVPAQTGCLPSTWEALRPPSGGRPARASRTRWERLHSLGTVTLTWPTLPSANTSLHNSQART